VLNYQTGTGVAVELGADVCADQIQFHGTFSGRGTICGAIAFILNLTGFIEGFYSSSSDEMISYITLVGTSAGFTLCSLFLLQL